MSLSSAFRTRQLDSEAIGGAEVPREMNKYGNVLTGKLPWWMSIIVVIGLGEIR